MDLKNSRAEFLHLKKIIINFQKDFCNFFYVCTTTGRLFMCDVFSITQLNSAIGHKFDFFSVQTMVDSSYHL